MKGNLTTDCRGDLLLRARRGLITDSERLALSAHLASCEACQLLSEFGRDFEAVGGAAVGDSAVLARISERTLRNVRSPRLRSPRLRVYWLAAASIVLLAGLAGATWLNQSRRPVPSSNTAWPGRPAVVSAALPAAPATTAVPLAAPATTGEGVPPEVATSGVARTINSVPTLRAPETADSLFREANEARRAGETAHAVSLYRELQRRFPAAAETSISRVSLGSMLLDTGASGPALRQFESYLAKPEGSLAAEALYGRGRALKNLHRPAEEAATWRSLLERFPRAPYASYAKRRLSELE